MSSSTPTGSSQILDINKTLIVRRFGKLELGYTQIPVDRKTCLGNPFYLANVHDAEERKRVCEAHQAYINAILNDKPFDIDEYARENNLKRVRNFTVNNEEIRSEINNIAERVKRGEKIQLVCYCHPRQCHADNYVKAIKEIINQSTIKERVANLERKEKQERAKQKASPAKGQPRKGKDIGLS